MPIVTVQMFKGRSLEVKRELVKRVTEAVTETTGLKPETVTVVIEELDKENWAIGGQLFSDR